MERDAKVFTFDEARRLLPRVREYTRQSIEKIGAAQETGGQDEHTLQEMAAEILGEWAQKVRALGIEVKGPWLVDFDSGSGYFCWKWPEDGLEFFHGYEEGFAGRVRIQ